MSKEGKPIRLEKGQQLAQELLDYLRPAIYWGAIAGSVRRRRPWVHDLDIVVLPIYESFEQPSLLSAERQVTFWSSRLAKTLRPWVEVKPEARAIRFEHQGVGVDLYLVEPDGSNKQALLQLRTGSAVFNQFLAMRALQLGLKYQAGYGIFRNGERIDDGTENGIFLALDLPNLGPTEREQAYSYPINWAAVRANRGEG